ncbi:hypothetical protein [Vineibacter terrae]|uniref:hypothetical protein n=1 Tax=Vineibacter terrae TaxID=2586908 RepID=UPI0015B70478|nr:hypothetical protein [Vineibacter terrae]
MLEVDASRREHEEDLLALVVLAFFNQPAGAADPNQMDENKRIVLDSHEKV